MELLDVDCNPSPLARHFSCVFYYIDQDKTGHFFIVGLVVQVKNWSRNRPEKNIEEFNSTDSTSNQRDRGKGTSPSSLVPRVCLWSLPGWMDVELAINYSSVCPLLCLTVCPGLGRRDNKHCWDRWGTREGPLTLSFSGLSLLPLHFFFFCYFAICCTFLFGCRVSFRWISFGSSSVHSRIESLVTEEQSFELDWDTLWEQETGQCIY